MTLNKKDLIYWYREFWPLLSGWTKEEQIQFHKYAISELKRLIKERGSK